MLKVICSDIEGDNLLDDITKVWCASYTHLDENLKVERSYTHVDTNKIVEMFSDPNNIMIIHNGIGYDKPAMEKVLGFKVKAEIVDTLFLSWYLYPKMVKHGLAAWGEELGIAKVEIGDWENLTLKEYVLRCEVDVKIQVALWRQIWKHLNLTYETEEGCWHLIRHLNFKAKCAAMQKSAKWKLDEGKAEKLEIVLSDRFSEARVSLEVNMPEAPVFAKKSRPAKPFKANGSMSVHGERWNLFCEKYGIDFDSVEEHKYINAYKPPNAGSSIQVKKWLYSLGWVPETFEFVRNKNTNEVKKIPKIKDPITENICTSVEILIEKEPSLEYLREMSIIRHRLAVVRGLLKNVDEDGFVYAAIQGLTNTLRFKHKICSNLVAVNKPWGKELRGLLKARNSKMEICGSDLVAIEDRTKLHYMFEHDPGYIKEVTKKGYDPHTAMAVKAKLMTEAEAEFHKWYKAKHK